MKQQLDPVTTLNASIAKFTLASLNAKLNVSKCSDFQVHTIEKLKKNLVTKNKPKIANLPGNRKLLLASLESISDDRKVACYFLLAGDMVNGRGWGVKSESIPQNIQSFKGMPFVVTSNKFIPNSPYGEIYDHPTLEHLPILGLAEPGTIDLDDENLIKRFQNKFRIGEIIDVFEVDGIWRCLVAIDEKFRHKQLPQFVSPSLMMDDETEEEGHITKWHGLHLAGLDQKPAYGSIAILKGECEGPLGQCAIQLKNGSMGLNLESKIKNASLPNFVGFSDVRNINDDSFMFARISGPGITHGPKRMKLASCQIGSIVEPLKKAKKQLATLSSPDIAVTQKQVLLSDKIKKLKNAVEFDESEHPRDKDGKFTCKECGKSVNNSDKDEHEKSHKTDAKFQNTREGFLKTEKNFDNLRKTIDKFISDTNFKPETKLNYDGFPLHDFLRSTFSSYNIAPFSDDPEAVKQVWQELASKNPEIKKGWNELNEAVDNFNDLSNEAFKTSGSFYRGTSTDELDDYLRDGIIGSGKTAGNYNFTAVTPVKDAAKAYSSGVIIEYDGNDVRKLGEPVEYDLFWRDFGNYSETKSNAKMSAFYMDQLEVRLDKEIPLEKLKIKNIFISPSYKKLIGKYSKLGNVVVTDELGENNEE